MVELSGRSEMAFCGHGKETIISLESGLVCVNAESQRIMELHGWHPALFILWGTEP